MHGILSIFLSVAGALFVVALLSKRIHGTVISPAMLFVGAGLLGSRFVPGVDSMSFSDEGLNVLAELTLITVLAHDASRIDFKSLRRFSLLPARLLLIGGPLTVGLGAVLAVLVLPDVGWIAAFLIATILTPTDAALGEAALDNPAIPLDIRQSLNVESGLNDGMALPSVIFFACLLNAAAGNVHDQIENWWVYLSAQLVLGPVIGVLIGVAGGWLVLRASRAGWMDARWQGVALIALSVLAYAAAETVDGNGFIAAFTCGMAYGNLKSPFTREARDLSAIVAAVLTALTFFVFGVAILPEAVTASGPRVWLFAVLALTAMRMIPVAIALIGTGRGAGQAAFIGWMGPRGLASLLFAILVLGELAVPGGDRVLQVVAITIGLSVLLHGLTAAPLAKRLGASICGGGTPGTDGRNRTDTSEETGF